MTAEKWQEERDALTVVVVIRGVRTPDDEMITSVERKSPELALWRSTWEDWSETPRGPDGSP